MVYLNKFWTVVTCAQFSYNVQSLNILLVVDLLIRGTASEVLGIDSETALRKTVRDSKTVTSKVANISLH